MDRVRIREPETMHVLGLLLGAYLQQSLAAPKAAAAARALHGDLWLRAGGMWVTLRFDGGDIEVIRDRSEGRRAVVEGEMGELLVVVASVSLLARARALPALLRGRLSVSGDPRFLVRLLPVLMGGPRPAAT